MARARTKNVKKYNRNKPTNNKIKTNGDLTKFGKNYFTKKITNIIRNNTDINEYELLDELKQKNITTDNIEGNTNFRDLLRDILKKKSDYKPANNKKDKKTGKRKLEKETSNKIVDHFINEIVPLLSEKFKNTKIDYNDVITFIKGSNSDFKQEMLKTIADNNLFKNGKIPFKLGEMIQSFISKHRRNIAEKEPEEQGKNTFTIVFRAVVYDSRYNHRYTEKQKTTFKSDENLPYFDREFIKEKVQKYYDRLDYPDFIELLQHKVIKTTADVDISSIYLYNYGDNSKYNNIYIRPPDEYIIGWNKEAEKLEYKQCVKFNLRCGFGKFIDKLKNKDVFTDKYLDTFFINNGGFTIENILLFVKNELENMASIYILDPTGHVIVGSYINSKTKITINIDGTEQLKRIENTATTAFILNGKHVDLITEPNIIKSLASGSIPNLFETNLNTDNLKHELFDHPEIIALQADFNDVLGENKDYTENGKNTMADVVLLQDLEDEENQTEINQHVIKYGVLSYKDDGTMMININDNVGEMIEINPKYKILSYKNNGVVIDDGENTIEIVYQYKSNKSNKNDAVLIETVESIETLKFDVKIEIKPNIINKPFTIQNSDGTIEMCEQKGITDIQELIELVKKHYKVIITNILVDRYKKIYGFVHPITKQIYIKTNDFYKRKAVCDKMYDELGYNELKFNNQSWLSIIKLKMKYYNLGDFNQLLSNMSEYDREINQKYPLIQKIGRCEDDNLLNLRMRNSGTNNVYTFDLVKSRASILYNRIKDNYWAIGDAFDNYEIFDKNNIEHVQIPCGEYFLKEGDYGSEISQIKFNAGKYHDTTIKYLLEQEYITINDIIGIRICKKKLEGDYFKKLIIKLIEDHPECYKFMIVSLIGGLHQPNFKKNYGYFDDNLETAQAMTNYYNNNGFDAVLEPSLNDDLYYVLFQKSTPNFKTGSSIYRQIVEQEQINLDTNILQSMGKNSVLYSWNTDGWTVKNPDKSFVKLCKANENITNEFDKLGTVKIEQYIKIKGRYFDEVNKSHVIDWGLIQKQLYFKPTITKRQLYDKTEYNTTFVNDVKQLKCGLILGLYPGCGKSVLLELIFKTGDIILVPQHANRSSLLKEAKELKKQGLINVDITFKDVHVIADYFNDDTPDNEGLRKLKNRGTIFIDECFQISEQDLYKIYLLEIKYNKNVFCGGDYLQIPPVNAKYDIFNSSFFINTMLNGNIIELNYLNEFGRFSDNMTDYLDEIKDKQYIPKYFENNKSTLEFDKHLCLTNKKREEINKIVSIRKYNEFEGDKIMTDRGGYCVGMVLMADGNHVLYHVNHKNDKNKNYGLKNNFQYKITGIDTVNDKFNLICINTNEPLYNVDLFKILNFFKYSFCFTVDGAQGMKIDEPFCIWEMNNKLFTLNRVISSFGRTTKKDYIHIDLINFNKKFEYHKYPNNIIIKPQITDIDKQYENTNYYNITVNNEIRYIGLTTGTVENRLNEHWKTAKGNNRDKFHEFLLNCNTETVKINLIETVKHTAKCDAELYESELIQQYIKDGYKLLNTKIETYLNKCKEPIKITENKVKLTLEQYNILKYGKPKVKPTIYNNEQEQFLKVYYWIEKEPKQVFIRYKRIGYNKALEKANKIVEELKQKYND